MRCSGVPPLFRGPVDLHFGLSVGEEVTELLFICNQEAFVNCSDKQAFSPDTVKCLGAVKKGQGGLVRLGGLIIITDRLREAQDLVFD